MKIAPLTLHPPILRTHPVDWPDASACEALASAFATSPAIGNAFIALRGPLGAGKTTFARALLRALGVQGRIKSPTYALLEPYDVGGQTMAHIDLYRMNTPDEWATAGLRDTMAADGLKLIEWPERAGAHLPLPDVTIAIQVLDDDASNVDPTDPPRSVVLTAHTPLGERLLAHALRSQVAA